MEPTIRFCPLGDQAVLAYLADEAAAFAFAAGIREANPPWLQDVVPAYASVGVFFDAGQIETDKVTRGSNAIVRPRRPCRSRLAILPSPSAMSLGLILRVCAN